jgi:glycosyltransferase
MLSIITLTYNNFDDLKETLASLPKDDLIESIVVNGGNDSHTYEFLKTYKGKVINEKDEGIADAFNKGIRISSGDAIMFLNSGDVLTDPAYPSEAYSILKKNKDIHFVHSNILFLDSLGAELFMKPSFCNPGRGLPYLHPTMIVRKSVFDEIGMFNTDYKIAMDFDFVVRLTKKGYKGFYKEGNAVVKMEGTGKSANEEWAAIKECYASLKQNDFLTIKNFVGLSERVTLFLLRKLLVNIGAGSFLKSLKKLKYPTIC